MAPGLFFTTANSLQLARSADKDRIGAGRPGDIKLNTLSHAGWKSEWNESSRNRIGLKAHFHVARPFSERMK